jgi:two-component system CheB/CheR fusion protein
MSAESWPRGRSLCVLVVDDNADACASLALFLASAGHEIHTARDGAAAIAVASAYELDVVLMDLALPRMDGYETAQRIRGLPLTKLPLFVSISGHSQDSDRARSLAEGFQCHLTKPINPDTLLNVLCALGTLPG